MAIAVRPVVGLRSGPRTQSELLTQEAWGRTLKPLMKRGDWLRCRAADGMTGWVPASAVADSASYRPTHVVRRRFARLRRARRADVMLPMGSLVMVEGTAGVSARVFGPDGLGGRLAAGCLEKLAGGRVGPGRPAGAARAGSALDGLVPEVIGTPYLWGGKSTFGFDCSGLVQVLYEFLGVGLPRDSGDQASRGRKLRSLAGLRPLDLIFFGSRGRIDHVAIHLGDLRVLHASGHVRLESLRQGAPGFRADLRERFAWATRPIK
jgi:hypothetical protein